jgi:hypothetical protein
MSNDERVPIVNVNAYGNEMWYFRDKADLDAFKILRRGAIDEPKGMTPKDKRALQRLGVEFELFNAQQKRNRHGKLTSGYKIEETGEEWIPPWKEGAG